MLLEPSEEDSLRGAGRDVEVEGRLGAGRLAREDPDAEGLLGGVAGRTDRGELAGADARGDAGVLLRGTRTCPELRDGAGRVTSRRSLLRILSITLRGV